MIFLRLPISRRRSTLIVLDMLAYLLASIGALLLRFHSHYVNGYIQYRWGLAILAIATLMLIDLGGFYGLNADLRRVRNFLRLILWMAVAELIISAGSYLLPRTALGRGVALLVLALTPIFIAILRNIYFLLCSTGLLHRSTAIIGGNAEALEVAELLRNTCNSDRVLVGLVTENVPVDHAETQWLGSYSQLSDLIRQHQIETLILTEHRDNHQCAQSVLNCWAKHPELELLDGPTLIEEILGRLPIHNLDHEWCLGAIAAHRNQWYMRFGKRAVDFVGAVVLLVLLSPLLLAGIIGNLFSRGPVFYSQERIGTRRCLFRIYKLRSMIVNAENNGAVWAQPNDVRITRWGRWLRKTRVDEIPQLWNVLRGDMSLVGPRPERPEFAASLAKAIPYFDLRHAVPPGITGWAQVNYHYCSSLEDIRTKLEFDLYYVKNACLTLDLYILLRTTRTMLFREGATPPQSPHRPADVAEKSRAAVGSG